MSQSKNPRRVEENEAMAYARGMKTSPRKLNLVAQSIRGLDASAALNQLTFNRRRIALDVKKVLQAAIANAENNHQLDVDRLYVEEASVGRAFAMNPARSQPEKLDSPKYDLTSLAAFGKDVFTFARVIFQSDPARESRRSDSAAGHSPDRRNMEFAL